MMPLKMGIADDEAFLLLFFLFELALPDYRRERFKCSLKKKKSVPSSLNISSFFLKISCFIVIQKKKIKIC